jgi:hypothetical protein
MGPCSSIDQQLGAEDLPLLVESRISSKEDSGVLWQLYPDSVQADLQQQLDQPQQQGPEQAQASRDPHETFDMDCVDMGEQQRLLEDFERRQRLKKSLVIQAASRSTQHRGRRNSKGCPVGVGPAKQSGILKKDAKQPRKGK